MKKNTALINIYTNKINWWEDLDQIKDKLDADVFNIFKLHQKLHEIKPHESNLLSEKFNQAIPQFNKFLLKKCDPTIQFLFLLYWFEVCLKLYKFPDADFVKNHLEKLLNDALPPELKSHYYGHMGIYHRKCGNPAEGNKLLLKCVEVFNSENPRYAPILINYGNITCYFGTYPNIKKEVNQIIPNADKPYQDWVHLLLFFYSVEMGHVKTAWHSLKKIPINSTIHLIAYHQFKINYYVMLLKLMVTIWKISPLTLGEETEIINFIEHNYPKHKEEKKSREITEIITEIYYGNYNTANEKSLKTKGKGFWEYSWIYCIHLRAELAAGRFGTAELTLKSLEEKGYEYIWNDWFRTRIELAKGNLDHSRYYFNKFLKSIKKHKAEDRFNFEVKISNDIKTTDLLLLTNYKNDEKPKIKSPKKITDVTKANSIPEIIGNSKKVLSLKKAISKAAPHDINVLIIGETGTGKEVVAKSIHNLSRRKKSPYIAINCAAISETLLESELFGHLKGAFTGATEYHKGVFEQAGEGTVFLDEIGEITPAIQSALLRVLETKDIKPIGSSKSLKIKCRIVAATNANLESKVKNKEFRMDLLHRLKRFVVHTNPLRKKLEDLPLLCQYFLNQNPDFTTEATLTFEAIEALKQYKWPGNARELKNEMENLRILNYEKTNYDLEDLDIKFKSKFDSNTEAESISLSSLQHYENSEKSNQKQDIASDVLSNNKISFRRIERIKELFDKHSVLTRAEIIKIMSISHLTATKDLKILIEEDYIKKIMPSKSPRSHYFEKK